MLIDGIGISGFRSFDESLQRLGPFGKVNLFIGQNNSGKSNILRFLNDIYRDQVTARRNNSGFVYKDLDRHNSKDCDTVPFEFALRLDGEQFNSFNGNWPRDPACQSLLERILKSNAMSAGGELVWLRYFRNRDSNAFELDLNFVQALIDENVLTEQEWIQLATRVVGSQKTLDVKQIVNGMFAYWSPPLPDVYLVSAFRGIGKGGIRDDRDFSGQGLIERLAQLQHPAYDKQESKLKFRTIQDLLRDVTGNVTAEIEVPHGGDTIHVRTDNKTLPLPNLGTGIHEVIILAVAATVLSNKVLCIEEPELHLHPILQKKLSRYLAEKTDNQYFITTHSAHLMDTPGVAIFHVRNQNGVSKVELVSTDRAKSHICSDLGYHASDLLQSNCVIWVEGPSDRIYLNHWMQALRNDLIEGVHFSIMFYGGRLLSHLTTQKLTISSLFGGSTEILPSSWIVIGAAPTLTSTKRRSGSEASLTRGQVLHGLQREEKLRTTFRPN